MIYPFGIYEVINSGQGSALCPELMCSWGMFADIKPPQQVADCCTYSSCCMFAVISAQTIALSASLYAEMTLTGMLDEKRNAVV